MADTIAGTYVRINPDLTAFREELRGELDAATAGLEGKAKLSLDTGDTDAKLAATTVEAEGTKAALDDMGSSSGGAGAGLRNLGNDASSASQGMGLLASSILAFAPLAPALGGIIGGSFAALPGIFAGVGAGAGALLVGLNGIPTALKAVSAASDTAGKSAAQVATDQKNLAKALGDLSPAGRDFVAFVNSDLLPAFDGLTGKVQSALLPQLQSALSNLTPLFQPLQGFIVNAANGIGQLAEKFAQFMSSTEGLKIFNTLMSQGAEFMTKLGGAALTFFEAFGRLGSQAGPIVQGIANALVSGANAFNRWTTDGGAARFLAYVEQVGPQVFSALSNIVHTFGDLLSALSPLAGPELDVIRFISSLADELIRANPQLAALLVTGIGIAGLLGKLKSGLEGLSFLKVVGGVGSIGAAAEGATTKVGLLEGSLVALSRLGPIAVAITVAEILKPVSLGSEPGTKSTGGTPFTAADAQKQLAADKNAGDTVDQLKTIAANLNQLVKTTGQQGRITASGQIIGGPKAPPATDINSILAALNKSLTGGGNKLLDQSLAGAGAPAAAAAQTAAVKAAQAKIVADTKAGQTELNRLITASTSTSLASLKTSLDQIHTTAMNSIVNKLDGDHKTGLTAMANQIVAEHKKVLEQQAAEEKAAREKAYDQALQSSGKSALSTQQGLGTSTNVSQLADALQPVHEAALKDLESKLLDQHSKADTSLANQLVAANKTALANLNTQLAALAAQTYNTETRDNAAANAQQTSDISAAATNLSAAATEMASDVAKAMSDISSGQVSAINDAAKVASDIGAQQIAAINDNSQILVDQMAETGLTGIALQEQQAKVALDQLKAVDDQKLALDQIALDQAKQTDDAAIAAAQQHLDDVTIQQAALVAAAQATLDSVRITTDADVNAATLSLDIVSLGSNAALQAQVQGDYANVIARASGQMADATAGLANAQSTQSTVVGAAANSLQGIKDAAAKLEATLAANQSSDQTKAGIAEANQGAILATLTEQSTLQQQQIAATNQTTAAVNAQNQLNVHLAVTDSGNPHAAIEEMMFQLRLAGVA